MPKNKSRKSSVYAVQIAQSLPAKPKDAVAYICEAFAGWHARNPDHTQAELEQLAEQYAEYMGFFALLNMHSENLNLTIIEPTFTGDKTNDIQAIVDFFSQVRHQLALMTLDLSLLSSLSQQADDQEVARFHKISDEEKIKISNLCQALKALIENTSDVSSAAQDRFSEKLSILLEQFAHAVIDLDLAWRFISQTSVLLNTQEDTQQAADLLRSLSSELWRIQARKEKVPESTLKSIITKLTHPARWEAESASKDGDEISNQGE